MTAYDEEDEDPDDADDESVTVPCPECGVDVYEDAERCPSCESYITRVTNPWVGRPTWWIVLGLLGILSVIAWLMRF